MKVIAFFVRLFFCRFRARFELEIQPEINRKPCGLISSRLGLNREFNWEFNREFPVQPRIQPGIPVLPQTAIFL
jgi:hypothetical protein